MQIIPVIDVLGGQVVRAVAGNRSDYLPVTSLITSAITPSGVIEDLLRFYDFKTIYIAELDAIQFAQLNTAFYVALFKQFPDITFWFDYGVTKPSDLNVFTSLENVRVVAGTETITDASLLFEDDIVLSLDYRHGKPLGLEQLHHHAELWPKQVIIMSLDQVGKQLGPNYELLDVISAENYRCDYFAAGGIRNQQDLICLAEKGIKGVLIASALHNGRVNQKVLRQFE